MDNGKDRETYDNIIGFTEENHAWAWRENIEELYNDGSAYTCMGAAVDKLLSLEEAII